MTRQSRSCVDSARAGWSDLSAVVNGKAGASPSLCRKVVGRISGSAIRPTDLPAMANQIRAFGLRQISPTGKSALALPPSRAHKRGASRSSRTLGAGCDGRGSVRRARMRAGRMTLMRTVKSCRSDAPMLASSLREVAEATVSNKPGHRGEREVSRKTIAQGRPGLLR